jgi:hypothetical protein
VLEEKTTINDYKGTVSSEMGITINGKTIAMRFKKDSNGFTESGGDNTDFVQHEILHLLGLDDEINKETGEKNTYFDKDGRMSYKITNGGLKPVSPGDILNIIKYAQENNGLDILGKAKAIIQIGQSKLTKSSKLTKCENFKK